MADIYTGVEVVAMATSSPSAHSKVRALKSWAAHFGAPRVAESDQGIHFTATSVKMLCGTYNGITI